MANIYGTWVKLTEVVSGEVKKQTKNKTNIKTNKRPITLDKSVENNNNDESKNVALNNKNFFFNVNLH